jgi:hypothetical protein
MYVHKIPTTAAAFSIGGASAEMAKMAAVDIVLPTIYGLAALVFRFEGAPPFKIKPFFNAVVTWVCVLFASYVLVEYVFGRTVMGMSTVVVGDDQRREMGQARRQAIEPIVKAGEAVRAVVPFISAGAPAYAPVPEAMAVVLESDRKSSSVVPRVLAGASVGGDAVTAPREVDASRAESAVASTA